MILDASKIGRDYRHRIAENPPSHFESGAVEVRLENADSL